MAESVIPIDEKLMVSEEFANLLTFIIGQNLTDFLPKLSLGKILAAKARTGLNSQITTSSVVSRFGDMGIPSGALADGTPNVMEAYTEGMIEEIFNAIQTMMRVDIALDAGATVSAAGANAGGPLTAVGATTAPHSGVGVAS